jgi:hypothetical protein
MGNLAAVFIALWAIIGMNLAVAIFNISLIGANPFKGGIRWWLLDNELKWYPPLIVIVWLIVFFCVR